MNWEYSTATTSSLFDIGTSTSSNYIDTTRTDAYTYQLDSMLNKIQKNINFNYSSNKYIIDKSNLNSLVWKEYEAFATGDQYWRENTDATTSITAGNYGPTWNAVSLGNGGSKWAPIAPGERMRQMIRDRMAPAIHRGRKRQSLSIAMDVREERARQTLRRIIGEQSFRRFMRDGFITVVPKSGLTYRIYPGHGITEVYDRGIMVDKLCVVLRGNYPPTDSLLMRYLLILNDEGEFSKFAIKHHVSNSTKLVFPTKEEVKPLTEAWAKLKVA